MIEVTQLGKSFGSLGAVRGIDFSVRPGEVGRCLGDWLPSPLERDDSE